MNLNVAIRKYQSKFIVNDVATPLAKQVGFKAINGKYHSLFMNLLIN